MAPGSSNCPPMLSWSTSRAAISSTTTRSSERCDRAGSPAPGWTCSTMSRAWMQDTSIFPMSSYNRTRGVRRWQRVSRWQTFYSLELTPSLPIPALQIGSFERRAAPLLVDRDGADFSKAQFHAENRRHSVSLQSIDVTASCSLLVPRNAEARSQRWIHSPGYDGLDVRFVHRTWAL